MISLCKNAALESRSSLILLSGQVLELRGRHLKSLPQ